MTAIPGYTHGTSAVVRSPVSLADLELIRRTLLFGDDDLRHLRMSRAVLADQTDQVLDVWYGFVGANPHLLASFTNASDGKPNTDYLGAVRKRFGQWILDTAGAQYDQAWLDYQHEVGLRHHRSKKNKTDGVSSTALVEFRYLFALAVPVTATLKPFLAKKGHPAAEVEGMHAAWLKSVLLQLTLWSYPYVRQGDF